MVSLFIYKVTSTLHFKRCIDFYFSVFYCVVYTQGVKLKQLRRWIVCTFSSVLGALATQFLSLLGVRSMLSSAEFLSIVLDLFSYS